MKPLINSTRPPPLIRISLKFTISLPNAIFGLSSGVKCAAQYKNSKMTKE